MVGYADAIIQRQDRYDILKKVESFQVESASRNALGELMDHFKQVDSANKSLIHNAKEQAQKIESKQNVDHLLIGKLQKAVAEIGPLNKRMLKAQQEADTVKMTQD